MFARREPEVELECGRAGACKEPSYDATYKDLGYMRGDPVEKQIESLVRKLKSLGVDIRHENHQMITSVRKVKIDNTGVVLQ